MAAYPVILPTPRSSSSSLSPSGIVTPWTYTTVVEQTPRTNADLPLPPPVLQPLRKHDLTTTGKPPPRRRREPPLQGLGWLVVIPGLVVALLSAGLATTLVLYLALRRDADAPSFVHGFYVDEMTKAGSPLLGLLISTVITNVVWLLGSPSSSAWQRIVSRDRGCHISNARARTAQSVDSIAIRLLFKLFSAPSPSAVYQLGSYIANRSLASPHPHSSPRLRPRFGVLGTASLISVADIWLHAVSAVVALPHRALPPIFQSPQARRPTPAPRALPPRARPHVHPPPVHARPPRPRPHPWTATLRSPPLTTRPEDVNTARVEVGVWDGDGDGARDGRGGGGRKRWGGEKEGVGEGVFGVYKKVVPYKGEIY
ncbi:hypothetical protein B0H12DRAFT_1076321 [Mycena haematopus]|nr:hypothetical protein B0H12DRAFT_1076321 [Mycena haematopus]